MLALAIAVAVQVLQLIQKLLDSAGEAEVDAGPSIKVLSAFAYSIIMLNDNFFPGIIRLKPENNGYTFWELRNRIIGRILSIIASCLYGTLPDFLPRYKSLAARD